MRAYKALGCEWFGRAVVDRMFIVTTIKLSVRLLYLGLQLSLLSRKPTQWKVASPKRSKENPDAESSSTVLEVPNFYKKREWG